MRTLEELEQAFRDMGLTKLTWGRKQPPGAVPDIADDKEYVIRTERNTKSTKVLERATEQP